jgi:glycosyltransferase involved in cell wall biosynthesis
MESTFIKHVNDLGLHCIQYVEVKQPRVSVLIREKDELVATKQFWLALERQTILAQAEIIVLDGGSKDGPLNYLRSKPCSVYGLTGTFNYGRSCNQLAALAKAPRLVYLSGHVLLEHPEALQKVVAFLEDTPNSAVYLRQVPNTVLGFNTYDVARLSRRFPPGDAPLPLREPAGFSNAASGLSLSAWQLQPFQEVHGSEDFLWAQLYLHKGNKLFYLPFVHAMHSHSDSPKEVHNLVRLSAIARGQTNSYGRVLYMTLGVYLSMLRSGSGHREAFQFAWAHGSAYL